MPFSAIRFLRCCRACLKSGGDPAPTSPGPHPPEPAEPACLALGDLVQAIQGAVAQANESAESQHLTLLSRYFTERDGRWHAITVPLAFGPATPEFVEVPLLSLVPVSTLRIQQFEIELTAALAGVPDEAGPATLLADLHAPPRAERTPARIRITFAGAEAPEGVMRLVTHAVRPLP